MPKNPFKRGGSPGYNSQYLPESEHQAYEAIGSRAGARRIVDSDGKVHYEFQDAMRPLTGREGVARAKSGFNFDPVNYSMRELSNPSAFNHTYQAGNVKYRGLPDKYGTMAYDRGARDIRREGQGQLEKLKETVGTRRPGLLLKAAQDSQRSIARDLGGLREGIAINRMDKDVDLDVAQQRDYNNERFKEYQSRADIEQRRADEKYRYNTALNNAAMSKIAMESGLLQNQRQYEDAAIQYLLGLLGGSGSVQGRGATPETPSMFENVVGAAI